MIFKKKSLCNGALYLSICLFLNNNLLADGFVRGTPVATPKGHRPIEELKVNDEVFSLNLQKGTVNVDKIIKIEKHKTNSLIQITVGDEVIEVDEDHKFYCSLLKNRWIKAKNLKKWDLLKRKISQLIPIERIAELEKEAEVYNISIEKNHNFLVSKRDIIVHNFFVEIFAAISAVSAAVEAKIGIDLVGITVGLVVSAVVNSIN